MTEPKLDETKPAGSGSSAGAEDAAKPEAVKPSGDAAGGRRSEGAVLDEMQAHKRRLKRLEEQLGLGDLELVDVKPLKPESFAGGAEALDLSDDLLESLL